MFEHAWEHIGRVEGPAQHVDDWSAKLAKDRMQPVVASEHSCVEHPSRAANQPVGTFEQSSCEHPSSPLHTWWLRKENHEQIEGKNSLPDEGEWGVKLDKIVTNPLYSPTIIDAQNAVEVHECPNRNQEACKGRKILRDQSSPQNEDCKEELDEEEKNLFQFFHPSQNERFNEQQTFQLGGVPGFETTSEGKRRKLQREHSKPVQEDLVPNNGNGGSRLMTKLPDELGLSNDTPENGQTAGAPPSMKEVEIYLMHSEQSKAPFKIRANNGKQIAEAEKQLTPEQPVIVTDWLGNSIDLNAEFHQNQFIRLHTSEDNCDHRPTELVNCTVGQALWKQRGWVNKDEMVFYLSVLEEVFPGQTMEGCILPQNPMKPFDLGRTILRALGKSHETQKPVATDVMDNHHWVPLVIEHKDKHVTIITEDSFHQEVVNMGSAIWSLDEFTVQSEKISTVFANDCGFQTIGWLQAKLLQLPAETPFTEAQAIEWRILYHEVLEKQQQHEKQLKLPIPMAGVKNGSMAFILKELKSVQVNYANP